MNTKLVPLNILNLYLIKISKWFNLVMPIVVLFYLDNGLNMSQIFLLKSIYSIGIVIMEIPSGYLADVWGRKKTLLWGSILGAVGFSIYSISHDFIGFALAEIVLGIGYSFVSGADSAMLYDSLKFRGKEKEYIRYEGQITSAGNFAEALAGIAGGLLATISLRTPYFFQIAVAAMAIPAAFYLKEPKHDLIRTRALKLRDILSTIQLTLKKGVLRSTLLVSAFTGTATLTYAWFVQPYFIEAGISVTWFGILWTLLNLSVGLSSMFSYRIENKLGYKLSLILVVLLIGIGFVATGMQISLAGLSILFGFYLIRGIAHPILKDYLNRYTESEVRATILSMRNFIIRINFAIIGPILGYMTDHFSLKTALIVSGISYTAAALFSLIPMLKNLDKQ